MSIIVEPVDFKVERRFIEEALRRPVESVTQVARGRNNRVAKVCAGGKTFAFKHYFQDKLDGRDRLGHEFSFLEFAKTININCIPDPIAKDEKNGWGLYEFIDGVSVSSEGLSEALVLAASDFFIALNTIEFKSHAMRLPDASESAFTVERTLEITEQRMRRLNGIVVADDVDREAQMFIGGDLAASWRALTASIMPKLGRFVSQPDEVLSLEERCVSPSDFGFHNAIIGSDGQPRFIDFEYAGWDDPVKALSDFFLQPDVPVPMKYFEKISSEWSHLVRRPELFELRLKLLFPVYQLRWCCILLNEFLSEGAKRRTFATPEDRMCTKLSQIEKARKMLARQTPFVDNHAS